MFKSEMQVQMNPKKFTKYGLFITRMQHFSIIDVASPKFWERAKLLTGATVRY